jgi:predicted RNase H-related nuclease YkuK (DUF458 family)
MNWRDKKMRTKKFITVNLKNNAIICGTTCEYYKNSLSVFEAVEAFLIANYGAVNLANLGNPTPADPSGDILDYRVEYNIN